MTRPKLAIINSDPKDFAYGGVAPIMRNMHPALEKAFDISYFYLPDSWKRLPLPGRAKVLLYIRSCRSRLKNFDFILSHIPEGSYAVASLGVPFAHIYHGNTNPMVVSKYWFGKYFRGVFESFFRTIEQKAALRYTVGPVWEGVRKLVNPIRHSVTPVPLSERRGFIYAGRLENGKNIDRIIRLYARLSDEERAANPLTIAGTGTLEAYLKTLAAQLGIAGNVCFTGMMPNAELVKLDSHQRLLLMASDFEGFPTAIAEAMTLGVPVVTTDVGDIPRFIRDGVNGRMLKPGFSDEEYIAAIHSVLADYDRYAAAALETGRIFDADTITGEIIADIKKIIGQ